MKGCFNFLITCIILLAFCGLMSGITSIFFKSDVKKDKIIKNDYYYLQKNNYNNVSVCDTVINYKNYNQNYNYTPSRSGAICNDGSFSQATGSGACSHHGGVSYWVN